MECCRLVSFFDIVPSSTTLAIMKTTHFWALIALCAPAVLAQSTRTTASQTSATSAAPSCTASLITKLCDYPEPGDDFAVAEDTPGCWAYCNAHPPCNFAIFAAGNPNTGSGTCWLYPAQNFDASAGSKNCGNPYLSVYDKPVCAGTPSATATTSSGACAATAAPSAIASVCSYPTPPGGCFDDCTASSSAVDCLSQCVDAASCSYAIFNPHNGNNSPYGSGTCWIYPSGTYDAGSAKTCSGKPEQFVYKNPCPKGSSSPSLSSSPSPSSSPSSSSAGNSTKTEGNTQNSTPGSHNVASSSFSLSKSLAVGMAAVLLWRSL